MSTRSRAGGGANDGEVHGKSNGSHAGSGIGNRDRLHSNTRRSALAGGMTMTRIRNRLQRATSHMLERIWHMLCDPYRPEQHYMRGPGPKYRAKNQM